MIRTFRLLHACRTYWIGKRAVSAVVRRVAMGIMLLSGGIASAQAPASIPVGTLAGTPIVNTARLNYDLGSDARDVRLEVPDHLPTVLADAGLLERVLVNLVANALRFSPADHPPRLSAASLGDHLEVRVIDRGPGIPADQRDEVFLPFQRLGDTDNTTGVGLGLALSRGLTEAMGGSLEAEDTPGGGLTMVVRLQPGDEPVELEPGLRERATSNRAGPS